MELYRDKPSRIFAGHQDVAGVAGPGPVISGVSNPRYRWTILLLVFLRLVITAPATDEAAAITETRLAEFSGPRGATMFRSLPPAETGIVTENRYADPKMWGQRHTEFAIGAIGTGIAI